jgi:hypothetical protein
MFSGSGCGGIVGMLMSGINRKVEAMWAIRSAVGTSEVRGVEAAMMTHWKKFGSVGVDGSRLICGGWLICSSRCGGSVVDGCSVWMLLMKHPRESLC